MIIDKMIEFKPISLNEKALFERYLSDSTERGCEYSFVNLFLWGRQNAALLHDHIVIFSQFDRRSVYPFPIGSGDKRAVLDAIIADAKERGIPCRITGILAAEKQLIEELYPDKFHFHCDRNSHDYIYSIDALADLKGKKYHSKKNHYNRFQATFPEYTAQPVSEDNLPLVRQMLDSWYADRQKADPESDFHMEKLAISRALRHHRELELEGLILLCGEKVLAVSLGSRISNSTFDVHFEKARADADGAYAAINCEFARYIRSKYPDIQFLNREDDLGIEGLRKAKLSYHPHHMVEKCWAHLLEAEDEG